MTLRALDENGLRGLLQHLVEQHRCAGVVEQNGRHLFDEVKSADEIVLDYQTTSLPPKKFLFPPVQPLVKFALDGSETGEAILDGGVDAIVGVHPCDLHAIERIDRAMSHPVPDEHWARMKARAMLIGVDCMPDAHCFCSYVGAAEPGSSFDVFLTPLDAGRWAAESGSERGEELLTQAAASPADAADVESLQQFRKRKAAAMRSGFDRDVASFPLLLERHYESQVWTERTTKCLGCGTCNIVCPTCVCFDVRDHVSLPPVAGVRARHWDGCLLRDFAVVASGENFREQPVERYRHRYLRKFQYLMTRFHTPFCVGCARCTRQCIPNVADPVSVINQVLGDAGQS